MKCTPYKEETLLDLLLQLLHDRVVHVNFHIFWGYGTQAQADVEFLLIIKGPHIADILYLPSYKMTFKANKNNLKSKGHLMQVFQKLTFESLGLDLFSLVT